MRVTSSLWVSALIRRAQSEGAFATVVHKGAAEAGAVFVCVNDLDNNLALYGPAPQMLYDAGRPSERQFECLLMGQSQGEIDQKISRERSFDPDIWLVEIEDRLARSFIDTVIDPNQQT